jgi:Protein of unknown function (DUF3551)
MAGARAVRLMFAAKAGATRETTMRLIISALGIFLTMAAFGGPAEAQNYPWCAYWHGTGGSRNCGFITYEQCMWTARGAGADCRANTWYEPNKPMR